MGILERFSSIMKSNINAVLDKCEDPERMIDQYLKDAVDNLEEVKKHTAEVMATEKRAKDALDKQADEVEKWQNLATKAVQAGNDEDAKTLLTKKIEAQKQLEVYQQTYALAHSDAEKMRAMHDKLVDDIAALKQRRDAVKAKMAVAKTYASASKAGAASSSHQDTMRGFDRIEEKVDRMLAVEIAKGELDKPKSDAASELEAKYNTSSVDDELLKLKAELGL